MTWSGSVGERKEMELAHGEGFDTCGPIVPVGLPSRRTRSIADVIQSRLLFSGHILCIAGRIRKLYKAHACKPELIVPFHNVSGTPSRDGYQSFLAQMKTSLNQEPYSCAH
jgi:hypothetical protein